MREPKLRLGVLLPSSNFVPFLADDLLAALEFGLVEARLEAQLTVEFAGYNADLKLLAPKIQQLLSAQRVAAVVAPLNPSLLDKLAAQFENHLVPLIALTLGEDPLFEAAQSPHILVNNFHLWETAWMCGYVGARQLGPRGAALVALHEGGYGLNFAFQLGLEAGQGSLSQIAVTHRNSSTEDPSPAIAAIAADKPDFIWAAYSGKEAASFLSAFEASGEKQNIPLVGLPPLVDEHVRKAAGAAALGIHVITAGPRGTETDGVIAALGRAIGRAPNPYALLAYESVHLLSSAIRTINTGNLSADLAPALRQARCRGPRGMARFDDGNVIEGPFCFQRVTASGIDPIEEVTAPPLLRDQYLLACQKLIKQGWNNPYLCA